MGSVAAVAQSRQSPASDRLVRIAGVVEAGATSAALVSAPAAGPAPFSTPRAC